MRKTQVATAVALGMGTVGVQAATINDIDFNFYPPGATVPTHTDTLVSGTITGTANGGFGGTLNSGIDFNNVPWSATTNFYSEAHSTTVNWAGTLPDGGTTMIASVGTFPTSNSWSYDFHMTGNQVAFGLLFSWNNNENIPVLAVFDCAPGTAGTVCTPVDVGDGATPSTGNGDPGTAMQAGPFTGQNAVFGGTNLETTPFSGVVPVPAAVWLFGSGLLGLAGVARRGRSTAS